MAFKTPNFASEFVRACLGGQLLDDFSFDKSPCVAHKFMGRGLGADAENTLKAMESYADTHMIPVLLPESAVFLRQLCMLARPKKVLEIGTGIGYSGHIILQNSSAHLFSTEHNEQSIATATDFFSASGLLDRVTFLRGDESEIIQVLSGEYDFIFLDGAKTRYAAHLPYLKKLLVSGGVLLADNVLFGGMVSGEREAGRKKTIAVGLREFLKNLCSDTDFSTSILPVGDGMSLSIKL